MEKFTDYLIIGSGVAGYHALKQLENENVIMVTSDKYYPYDRPPLSKEYLRGKIDRNSIFFEKPNYYTKGENIRIILNTSVEKINVKEKEAELSDGTVIHFDKALIATGGRPRKLKLPGEELEGIHYLRTLDECDSLKQEKGKEAVIIGGGFIGIEVASSLTMLGVKTTVIEVKSYIWNTLVDEKISRLIQSYFEKHGVNFVLNEGVKEFVGDKRVSKVITEGGKTLNADFVLIAIGIVPNIEIAQKSGIEVDNGIIANEYLETSAKDIYVAGDVANIYDPAIGKRRRIEHWNNAEYTGKLAAKNMLGKREKYNFLSTIWSDIFDLHIESGGDTMDYDEYIIRGNFSVDNPNFNVIYLKGGVIKGYVAINRDYEELSALNKLIVSKVDVSNKKNELKDEKYDLSKLSL
ncbi:NAD(P)/FAD-dependent oxidoreductase [Sulfurisphaera ohwakuensis]|uniref:NAD(P)/FAD-dependent oxidoreductase n=1 Tax=Sulfurisphaera ohwakuensis TaxID=69656 RepID=A0A650CKJ7_SULOH|nr:FAD-dependent oxidoreductase [Sulfurisphaera ohwakuensis]MBB5253688.1 NADPH-dependent 2,4-dienoyl-CoA reductase/sulfur reductase-like enzyme [Sulfurisphaera ohwakuensis]QGR18329.1 NAD(P)/FAD-dependent oxidoreductase [Sulfurisphaera ohwakuensis]